LSGIETGGENEGDEGEVVRRSVRCEVGGLDLLDADTEQFFRTEGKNTLEQCMRHKLRRYEYPNSKLEP
jgi:hypothetical protein